MTRWVGEPPRKPPPGPPDTQNITDDPLAALDFEGLRGKSRSSKSQVYSVSRVNPLFNLSSTKQPFTRPFKSTYNKHFQTTSHQFKPSSRNKSPEIDYDDQHFDYPHSRSHQEKSTSSGYEGSNGASSLESGTNDHLKPVEDAGLYVDQNPNFVKSIRIAGRGLKPIKPVPSQPSSSSGGGGTLTTIPEGHLDHRNLLIGNCGYDSLVDEALLLYTTNKLNNKYRENFQNGCIDNHFENHHFEISAKDLLLDLLASINQALDNQGSNPEEVLKTVNEKIKHKLEALRLCTEEEMGKLCVNLSNSRNVSSVLRAFSHGSTSSSDRARTSTSSNEDDFYQIPSGSSSSGFSDSPPGRRRTSTPLLPPLYGQKPSPFLFHHDSSTISRGIRNALIYGTLCRYKMSFSNNEGCGKLNQLEDIKSSSVNISSARNDCLKGACCDKSEGVLVVKGGSVPNVENNKDERPSVWQLYYGIKAEGQQCYGEVSPKDVPVFPGGRPETDFTLDVPRSEFLTKRLQDDKKWRFRCRLLTSFLGLVFFLLSVMAVSLILTRGKRMFGSMV